MKLGNKITAGLLAGSMFATAVSAKSGLEDNYEVGVRLFYVAVANEIRENCDTISARMFRAINYLYALKKYANDLGYTDAEMEKLGKDKVQQERLRVAVYDYLDSNGVDREVPASYCPLGVAEINKKTPIGALLRSR